MKHNNNLHLFWSDIVIESRLFKEAEYNINNSIFDNVYVLGNQKDGLPLEDLHPSGFQIFRIKLIIDLTKSWKMSRIKIFRLFNIFLSLFQYGLKSFSLTRHLKIKAISIHNLELLPLGVIIKLFFRIKLVYLPHELETEKSGSLPLLNLFYRFIEKFFIIFADYTVTVSKPIEDWYRNNYSLKNIATIRNVPNLNQLNTDYDVEDLRKKFKISEDEPLYIYQGLLSSGRGISLLTKTFEAAKKNIVFMGHGDLSLDIKNIKKKYINYLEPVKMEKICAQTSKADIGVHINEDESLSYKFSLPNKFFEYIHSGIPIIVSPNMEYLAKIIDENNLGWVVSPENLEELIKKINIKDCEILRTNIEKFAKEAIYENDAKIFKNIYMTQ